MKLSPGVLKMDSATLFGESNQVRFTVDESASTLGEEGYQLAINGHGLGYAQLLAAASYIHWACGDTHTASRLAHDALDHEPACSLAAIVISALRRDIQWATTAQ